MPATKTAAALALQAATRTAIRSRDAIEDVCSARWKAASAEARRLSLETTAAFDAAYSSGELPRPYWA